MPRAVGKTSTALRRAHPVHDLDDPETTALVGADPRRLVRGESPLETAEQAHGTPMRGVVRRGQRIPRAGVDEDPAHSGRSESAARGRGSR